MTPIAIVQPARIYQPPSYVHAMRAGDTLWIAGQVSRGPDGAIVAADDATAQARQCYANLRAVLAEAGADLSRVVKVTTYLVDRSDAPAVTAVRLAEFGALRPPHTGLIVAGLGVPEIRVEVEAVAWLG